MMIDVAYMKEVVKLDKVNEIPDDYISEQELFVWAFAYGKPGGDSKLLYDFTFLGERNAK